MSNGQVEVGVIAEIHCSVILREVLRGLECLHNEGQGHGSLNVENILVAEDGAVKLSNIQITNNLYTPPTTLDIPRHWLAPEQVYSYNKCDQTADIWAVGHTAMCMANGKSPFCQMNTARLCGALRRSPPTLEGDFSDSFKNFVSQCLRLLPEHRATIEQLLMHDFIQQHSKVSYKELVEIIEKCKRKQQK